MSYSFASLCPLPISVSTQAPCYGLTIRLNTAALLRDHISCEVAFFHIANKLCPLGFIPIAPQDFTRFSVPLARESVSTRIFLCLEPTLSSLLIMHETIEALQELPWLGTYTAELDAFEYR